MKGIAEHDVWVAQAGEMSGSVDRLTVIVVNNDDSHYWQGFESWDELNAFIDKLKFAGTEAFGTRA